MALCLDVEERTACEIFVGQNGRIWINGKMRIG
jgi:exosome complex RNA-binding protein Rrp4